MLLHAGSTAQIPSEDIIPKPTTTAAPTTAASVTEKKVNIDVVNNNGNNVPSFEEEGNHNNILAPALVCTTLLFGKTLLAHNERKLTHY